MFELTATALAFAQVIAAKVSALPSLVDLPGWH